jgi:hypothetical protein
MNETSYERCILKSMNSWLQAMSIKFRHKIKMNTATQDISEDIRWCVRAKGKKYI